MNLTLMSTRTHAHTQGTAKPENLTGVRKKRIKRTSIKECLIKPLKTGGCRKKEKRTKSEYQGNTLANQKISKSEYLENKKANEINEVRFQVRSGSLFERTSQRQSYQGLRGCFKSRFARFAFCDPLPLILTVVKK